MKIRTWSQIVLRTEQLLGVKTDEEGGALLGVSRQTYTKWKAQDVSVSCEHVIHLANVLLHAFEEEKIEVKSIDDVHLLNWAGGIRESGLPPQELIGNAFKVAFNCPRANMLGSVDFLVEVALQPIKLVLREFSLEHDQATLSVVGELQSGLDAYRNLLKDLLSNMTEVEGRFDHHQKSWMELVRILYKTKRPLMISQKKALEGLENMPSPLSWFDIDLESLKR